MTTRAATGVAAQGEAASQRTDLYPGALYLVSKRVLDVVGACVLLIGAGLVAIPVLLASTSYAIAGTSGWPAGLSKKPWQSEGFYLILTVAMLVSLVLALLRFDPIKLMFWANVLNGVLSPILVVYLIVVTNNRKIMRNRPVSLLTNVGLVLTAIVMFAAAILLFYGLATGQAG